jgi:hypothetical protein
MVPHSLEDVVEVFHFCLLYCTLDGSYIRTVPDGPSESSPGTDDNDTSKDWPDILCQLYALSKMSYLLTQTPT